MKEMLIQVIGDYVVTDMYWLDVPWLMSSLLLLICAIGVVLGLFMFLTRFSK